MRSALSLPHMYNAKPPIPSTTIYNVDYAFFPERLVCSFIISFAHLVI